MPLLSLNPATGEIIHRFAQTSPANINLALERAGRARSDWKRLPVEARAFFLRAIGKVLRDDAPSLAALMTAEMGKPIRDARAEIEKCAAACDYYAENAAGQLADERPKDAPEPGRVHYSPLGTVLGIMPWNFPFWQTFRAAIPAIVAGNVFLLKHSSNVCGCALACQEVMTRAELPPGVFQTLLVEAEAVSNLIKDPRIHGVTLTGSTSAGRRVAAAAGEALKPCVLELGGSDPYVVLADADLDLAARVCAQARLVNGGQSCVAAKRFIVAKAVMDEFLARLVTEMQAHRVGDPLEEATQIGPLARADLRDEVDRLVSESVAQGAKRHCGGEPLPGAGFYYPPTVLSGVRPQHSVFSDEVFGPVAAVVGAATETEAIGLANQTPFGLGAAIFSRNLRRAEVIAKHEIDAGMVFVNAAVRSDPSLPFGGIKASGFGRELGPWGARSFVNVKTLWIEG